MSKLVVDTWAWLEYLEGSESGKVVESKFAESEELWTSSVSLAELVSKYRRRGMSEEVAVRAVTSLSRVREVDADDAVEAGRIHAEVKAKSPGFGLADAMVLQLARKVGARVLTGDQDFRGVKEALLLR
jgi:predicted nucleic acid-binding protein